MVSDSGSNTSSDSDDDSDKDNDLTTVIAPRLVTKMTPTRAMPTRVVQASRRHNDTATVRGDRRLVRDQLSFRGR